jgi:hypothetical protein
MLYNDPTYFAMKAGDITLKLHTDKDLFYAEDVAAYEAMPDYEGLIGIQKIGFDDGGFSTEGTCTSFRDENMDSKETVIEGFYTDTMPLSFFIPYEVRIYIRYEENETEKSNNPETKKP